MKMMTMMLVGALGLLPQAAPPKQEKMSPETHSYFEYRDGAAGTTFKLEDGKVEFTAEGKTYKADSWDAFQRQHSDLVKKYDLERVLPRQMSPAEADRWWDDWASRFGKDEEARLREFLKDVPRESADASRKLDQWFDEEKRILDDLERRARTDPHTLAQSAAQGHGMLGVLVSPMPEALRSQLGLSTHGGLIVDQVEKGSLADHSGLVRYDLLLKISGKAIEDASGFRDQVAGAMKESQFTLEGLRGGKPLTLIIHPAHS